MTKNRVLRLHPGEDLRAAIDRHTLEYDISAG